MRKAAAIFLLLSSVIAVTLWGLRGVRAELVQPFDRHAAGFAGSTACASCHQDHHASWRRTYHRTMTQEASAQSVQGRFDGQVVTAWGQSIRPAQHDGKYWFQYLDARGGMISEVEIQRTVGSHRYQQYLTQVVDSGDNYIRLHLLWHNEDRRWVHLNGAFLHSDAQRFDAPIATWNHNCIFCHNTGPRPNIRNYEDLVARIGAGEPLNFLEAARYESEVAELGIACETCHGPGAEHAARNRNPLRRYALHLSGLSDPTIVHPARLDQSRQTYVCAQCHAQRLPVRLDLTETWLSSGPTFRAGDDLYQHVRPVTQQELGPPSNPDLYRLRFWNDATPRLSAYEFQGLAQSQCYLKSDITCLNCHDAHGGDPAGMMREGARGNAPCLTCHQPLAANLSAHTRHMPESAGSLCVNCHMPRMVYGVMDIHRSHRIEVPAPQQNARDQRPGACTGCHLDRSAVWAQNQIAAAGLPDDGVAENLRQLFGGDAVQRAVAAQLAGRQDSALSFEQRRSLIPLLLLAMEDGYPAVRRFAWKSLSAIAADTALQWPELGAFDFTGEPGARAAVISQLRRRASSLNLPPPDQALIAQLRLEAASRPAVNIGE